MLTIGCMRMKGPGVGLGLRLTLGLELGFRVWARVRYLVTSIGFRIGVSDRVRG